VASWRQFLILNWRWTVSEATYVRHCRNGSCRPLWSVRCL